MSASRLNAAAGDRLFIGVAVSTYEDERWERLDGVTEGVSRLRSLLEEQGYLTHLLESPSRQEVVEVLSEREALRGAGFEGPVVLVWSGHGDLIDDRLALIARDTPSGGGKEDMAYRPDALVSFLLDAGSRDHLVIIDACWAGAANAELLARHIRKLESTTSPEAEPAYAGVVSARGYERAQDGAFLTELLDLLEHGPVGADPGDWDLAWGRNSSAVPIRALLDTVARKERAREQHPRTWVFGASKISFPNPCFDPEAPAGLVDDELRIARGGAPRGEDLVVTPASVELIARVDQGRPGLWFITGGPGTGKSSCLALAAERAGRPVVRLWAGSGIGELAAAAVDGGDDAAVFVDALDEAPPRERAGIVDLAFGWSRIRFVAVAGRPPASGDAPESLAGAEQVVDMSASRWQGDAIQRYVVMRLRAA